MRPRWYIAWKMDFNCIVLSSLVTDVSSIGKWLQEYVVGTSGKAAVRDCELCLVNVNGFCDEGRTTYFAQSARYANY